MLINKSVNSLINGVSRQPPTLRLPSQAQEQINMFSTVASGPVRRPPMFHVAKILSGTPPSTIPFFHLMDRDPTHKYLVMIKGDNTAPVITDAITGANKTLTNAMPAAMLTTSNPRRDYRAISVADYTYLVNSAITPEQDTIAAGETGVPDMEKAVMMWWTGMNYSDTCSFAFQDGSGTTYSVAPYGSSTSTGSVSIYTIGYYLGYANAWSPVLTANMTKHYWNADPAGMLLITSTGTSTVLQAARASGGSFASYFRCANQSVQQFSDLPPVCLNGLVMKVQGTPAATFDVYYVKFTIDNPPAATTYINTAGMGIGYWRETCNGIRDLKEATFPYGLRPISGGTPTDFETVALPWGSRLAGDDNTAPTPTIVGVPIADLIFHRNRLGLIGGETLIFSEVGEYYNLWPTTVTTSLDSDPVDVQLTHNRISNIRFVVPFNEQLVIFTDVGQHILRSQFAEFTSKNLSSELVTAFPAKSDVRPCLIGDRIMFVQDQGTYSTVQEFLAEEQVDGYKVESITAHLQDYLPAKMTRMFGSAVHRTLFMLSDDQPGCMYVYRYFHAGKDKVMSSWSKMIFDGEVIFGEVSDNRIYLVLARDDGYHLCYMDLDLPKDNMVSGDDWLVHLDYRKTVSTPTWDAGLSNVVWNSIGYDTSVSTGLGYAVFTDNGECVALSPNIAGTGWQMFSSPLDQNDYLGRAAIVGIGYASSYEFSEAILRSATTNVPVTAGRLQMRTMRILFGDTGKLVATVNGGGSYATTHATSAPQDGEIRIPILANSHDYSVIAGNAQWEPYPLSIISMEWEAEYFHRGLQSNKAGSL